MPITAAPIKVESVKRLGGIIELVGETYAEAQTYAQVSLDVSAPAHTTTQHSTLNACPHANMCLCLAAGCGRSL